MHVLNIKVRRPGALLLGLALVFAALRSEGNDTLRVGVSVLPLESVVEAIGGDRVEAYSLQREGDSCSVFEPRPSVISWLSGAEVYFRTGAGYESVVMGKIERQFTQLRVVDLREVIEVLPAAGAHGHTHDPGEACAVCAGHTTSASDPHIWLDPQRMAVIAGRIAAVLSEVDPEGAVTYATRLATFLEEVEALDAELEARLEPLSGKAFYVYHPSLAYFADRYGLRQLALAGSHGEPTARELHQRVREAREAGVSFIVVQPQESHKHAAIVANAVGCALVEMDPMARDWLSGMRLIGEGLAEHLGRE